jgi:RNA polymerase sigma-70 factor (family 1)
MQETAVLNDKATYQEFEILFREQYQAMAAYAWNFLKNTQDAEDVVQDVFIRIWQNNPAIIRDPQVKFYLVTAVRNGCISFLRKLSGKTFVDADNLEQADEVSEAGETADPAELVKQALDTLPPQCQAIFKMSRFGKLTYQQIASELGLSVKTVENQMGKALRLMRDYARKNHVSFGLLVLLGELL